MKRWLLAVIILFLASCSSPEQQILDPNLSYDEAEQLVGESEVDLSTAATLSYDFSAEVESGDLSGTALKGELLAQSSDYAAGDYLPEFTVFEGALGLEDGSTLEAQGIIIAARLYVFFSSEDGLFIKGKGDVAEDGEVAGPFLIVSEAGSGKGSWQAEPKELTPTPEDPDAPTPEPEDPEDPDPENPEPEDPEPEDPEPAPPAEGTFAPWDASAWPEHYDSEGRLTKTFEISQDVTFVARSDAWEPELSPDLSGGAIFEIVQQGAQVDGNGLSVDVRNGRLEESVVDLYGSGEEPWVAEVETNGILYALENEPGTKDTLIKNFTLVGFNVGVGLGNAGEGHPVVLDNLTMLRNTFGLYTNGNQATFQNSDFLENGKGGLYSGSKSYGNKFFKNTFRDNALREAQPSYGDFIGDTVYSTEIVGNTFEPSVAPERATKRLGISIYRNSGENENLREQIPHDLLIADNTFEGYSVAVHLASRMGRNNGYDITQEGRDYAFYNTITGNTFTDNAVGIKLNSEGNTVSSNTFSNTEHEIVLHPVFFELLNTTINDQAGDTVDIWYEKSDYAAVPGQEYLFDFQDNSNQGIAKSQKRVEVFSDSGTPTFEAVGGLNDLFELNPPPTDPLDDFRLGSPLATATGEFSTDFEDDEVVAIWDEPISRIGDTDYYSIIISLPDGTEINRAGRSEVGWSQLAVGYFSRDSGEMDIAVVPKDAIDGKYPVYIFTRGFMEPREILYGDNTDPGIRISSDDENQLVVTYE